MYEQRKKEKRKKEKGEQKRGKKSEGKLSAHQIAHKVLVLPVWYNQMCTCKYQYKAIDTVVG